MIWWLRERCGKSEEVHLVMKSDLSGGQLQTPKPGLARRAAASESKAMPMHTELKAASRSKWALPPTRPAVCSGILEASPA